MVWEYKIVTGQNALTEAVLNDLGGVGWELVGITSRVVSDQVRAPRVDIVCVFKRSPLPSVPLRV